METQILNEIIDCLPNDRTVFRYARDDYALMLLSRFTGEGRRVCEVKQSRFGQLLSKPTIKQIIANNGKAELSQSDFDYVDVHHRQDFILTVGKWDRDHPDFSQSSSETGNLVVQVNFSTKHDDDFHRLIGSGAIDYFTNQSHPILKKGDRRYYRHTMGWARIDLDFETGEVLIEEIQNDWLREAAWYVSWMTRYMARCPDYQTKLGVKSTKETIECYAKEILKPFQRIWDEAILTATIQLCVQELGMTTIYYHTFDTGNRLKKIRWSSPPKSLYTNLPKKFCFCLTDDLPQFLKKSKVVKRKLKKVKSPHWFKLVM